KKFIILLYVLLRLPPSNPILWQPPRQDKDPTRHLRPSIHAMMRRCASATAHARRRLMVDMSRCPSRILATP
ncbi:hypothetical protein C8F01DRAFT_1137730, partial [Mycena amicta]